MIDKAQIQQTIARIERFWGHDIWRIDRSSDDLPLAARLGVLVARSLYIVVSGFRKERIKLRAAALTYVSLLSLVPAVAVVFSIFTAFGGLQEVENHVKSVLIDALAVSQREVVIEYLDRFVTQTSAGKLGSIGTAFLLTTVISLLANIERAFNDIWGVTRARTVLQRFQVYWPLVTLGPIVLGFSLSMTAAVEGSDTVQALLEVAPSLKLLLSLGPLLLTCLFFAFLYMVMPNTKVAFRHAIVGGLVGGGLWTLAQKLYALYAANAITYSAIYGSLGAVPLFVIWVYVSWTVALLGATLTFAVQSVRTFEPDREVSQEEREFVASRLMIAVAQHFEAGKGPMLVDELVDQVLAPPRFARRVLEELVQANLLSETTGDETGFVPGRPLDRLTLADVVKVMRTKSGRAPEKDEADPMCALVDGALDAGNKAAAEALSSKTLLDLAKAEPPPETVTPLSRSN